jgi:hypothetical protein
MAVAIVAERAMTPTTTAAVAAAVATTMAAVASAAAAAMMTAEARATVMAMTLAAASGSSKDGNGMTTDVQDAILPWYAEVVNVRSNNNANCTPAFDRGNIDGGVADLDNGVGQAYGVSNNGGERAATLAVVVAAMA